MGICFNKLFIASLVIFFSIGARAQYSAAPVTQAVTHAGDSLNFRSARAFTLQKDDYVKNLAFFCRQEWKIEKALKVPLRFRLGTLEQCNRLEGKQ